MSGTTSFLFQGQPVPPQPTGQDVSTAYPLWLQQYVSNLASSATNVANQPYSPFPGPQVATPSSATTGAWNLAQSNVGGWQPQLSQANNLIGQGGAPIDFNPLTGADIQKYMSPYQDQVIGALTTASNKNLFQNVLPQLQDRFVQSGQSRSPQEQQFTSNALYQNQQALDSAIANSLQAGYGQATQTATQQQGAGLSIAQANRQAQQQTGAEFGQLGALQQQLGSADVGQLAAAGQGQDIINQANINAALNNFYAQQQWPYQNLGFASNIIRGLPVGTNQQTVGTQYNPGQAYTSSPLASFVGSTLGAQALSNSYNKPYGMKRGGRVGYATGGIVPSAHARSVHRQAEDFRRAETDAGRMEKVPPDIDDWRLDKPHRNLTEDLNDQFWSPEMRRGGRVGYVEGGSVGPGNPRWMPRFSKNELMGSGLQSLMNNADGDEDLEDIRDSLRHHGLHVPRILSEARGGRVGYARGGQVRGALSMAEGGASRLPTTGIFAPTPYAGPSGALPGNLPQWSEIGGVPPGFSAVRAGEIPQYVANTDSGGSGLPVSPILGSWRMGGEDNYGYYTPGWNIGDFSGGGDNQAATSTRAPANFSAVGVPYDPSVNPDALYNNLGVVLPGSGTPYGQPDYTFTPEGAIPTKAGNRWSSAVDATTVWDPMTLAGFAVPLTAGAAVGALGALGAAGAAGAGAGAGAEAGAVGAAAAGEAGALGAEGGALGAADAASLGSGAGFAVPGATIAESGAADAAGLGSGAGFTAGIPVDTAAADPSIFAQLGELYNSTPVQTVRGLNTLKSVYDLGSGFATPSAQDQLLAAAASTGSAGQSAAPASATSSGAFQPIGAFGRLPNSAFYGNRGGRVPGALQRRAA